MIYFFWIIALLLLVSAALAEDLSKMNIYVVVYGVSAPGPTQDLAKINIYIVVTGGSLRAPASSNGFGSLSLGIN